MKKATLLMFFVMFGLLFNSCVEEGPMGPEGIPGKDGLDAEVYSSGWLHPTAWSLDPKNNEWFFQIQNSNITDYMLDEGLVVVYMSVPGDVYPGAVRQLPAYALGCNWDFVLPGAGTLEIISTSVNVPGTTDFLFRYVLIPGNILLKMQNLGINADELKKMPYNDLVNKLGSAGK